jgi:hypothetical protein
LVRRVPVKGRMIVKDYGVYRMPFVITFDRLNQLKG